MTPLNTLVASFNRLNQKQKSNLLYHAKRGTRILCGSEYRMFVNRGGG